MASDSSFVAALHEWTDVVMRLSMRNFIRFSKEKGLSMPQLGAMFRMRRGGGCQVSEIGAELGVTSAAASQMLERMVQQGLIARTEHPGDRRVKNVDLTAKGQAVLREGAHARLDWIARLEATLLPAEQAQVVAVLRLLIEKANQLDLPPDPE